MAFVQRGAVAMLVFELTVAGFAVGELAQAMKWCGAGSNVDLRGAIIFRLVFFAAIPALPLGRTLAPCAVLEGPAIFVVGAIIGWSGLLLRWWSIRTLGAHFTVVVKTSDDQVVIDRGPYRLLRHPGYTGLLAAFLDRSLGRGISEVPTHHRALGRNAADLEAVLASPEGIAADDDLKHFVTGTLEYSIGDEKQVELW